MSQESGKSIAEVYCRDVPLQKALAVASSALIRDGVVCLRGAFLKENVIEWREQFYTHILSAVKRSAFPYRTWSLGASRAHYILEIHKAFNSPSFYANEYVLGLSGLLLEKEFVMATAAIAYAESGAAEQRIHRDQPLIFRSDHVNRGLPPVSLTIALPLVETGEDVGGTEFAIGTHRKTSVDFSSLTFSRCATQLGDCLIWDSRLLHRGRKNPGSIGRPLVLMYFQRPSFFNFPNFTTDAEIKITDNALSNVPNEYKGLFQWARRIWPGPSYMATNDGECGCGSGQRYEECHGEL